MAIPKNDSYRTNFIFSLGLILAFVVVTRDISLADTKTSAQALIDTYKFSDAIAPKEAESVIARLKRALDACEDNDLAFRIRYRIGVIYFRAGKTGASKAEFRQIADDPKCPVPVRACSLNMIGQISRLRGENEQALEAFDKLANILKHRVSSDKEHTSNFAMTKLWCSAVLSMAEIYELQQNYTLGISEYSRLLDLLSKTENREMSSRYASLANDRMSQLYLRQANIDKYIKLAKALTVGYPKYHRTPMIRFELACVEFLNNTSTKTEFTVGAFSAPARLIACVKSSSGTIKVQNIVNKLSDLCSEYQGTSGGTLLQYHYAWLLDAIGEKDKAADIFVRISSRDDAKASKEPQENSIKESIREYAAIQYAIMAGEKADYKEALRVLSGLGTLPDKSHRSELAESVTQGIQTLRREVPRNENEEK